MAGRIPKLPNFDALPMDAGADVRSKRDALKNMIGQAKLMEIIDGAYDCADTCQNCNALRAWWEENGPAMPTAPLGGKKRVR